LALHEERFAETANLLQARREAQGQAANCLTH
jgi:hypothetical protein